MNAVNLQNIYFSETAVAGLLGRGVETIRKWRTKNKEAGRIAYGPPYGIDESGVVLYPKDDFAAWCACVPFVDGVPRMDMPCQTPTGTIH